MQVENIIALFQFGKIETENKKQKERIKLFVKLLPNKNTLKLINSEIFEEETFRENTKKELWKNFGIEDFVFINGSFYDSFANKLNERILQCGSICLLKNEVSLDDSWYEITIENNRILLTNKKEVIYIEYNKDINETYIVSANKMLSENHTQILVDAILKLKNTFLFTDLFLNYVDETFYLSEAIEFFNAFFNKTFSRATFKRRFADKVFLIDNTDNNLLYKKIK